ncbi:MAG: hypothetical protein U1E27_08970 [Kiritimatiellia bacterium]|nr:hypothetical protein [Kiritimatiellia bacterium]
MKPRQKAHLLCGLAWALVAGIAPMGCERDSSPPAEDAALWESYVGEWRGRYEEGENTEIAVTIIIRPDGVLQYRKTVYPENYRATPDWSVGFCAWRISPSIQTRLTHASLRWTGQYRAVLEMWTYITNSAGKTVRSTNSSIAGGIRMGRVR